MKPVFSSIVAALCVAVYPRINHADLGPIVITPTRTEAINESSATVYVLTADEIEASGAATTSELLRGMPGVQIDDLFGNGTQVGISVRGFSSTANANTLVLINGRRLNYSDTAGPDVHHVFPQDIERIEVLVGSAGSLYGDQAVGGVINIITKKPAASEHRISTSVGSFDYRGVEFNSSAVLSESLAYRLSAETFESNHFRDHNAEENTNFSGVLEYSTSNERLFVEVQEIDDELELPGALLEAEFDQDRRQVNAGFANDFVNEDTSVYRIGYALKTGQHEYSVDIGNRETDADVRISFRDNPSPEDGTTRRKNKSINPKWSGIMDWGLETKYVFGIDLEEADYDLEIPFFFFTPGVQRSSNEQKNKSLYFQINPRISTTTQLTFGMRRSSVDNEFTDGNAFPNGAETDDDITVREMGLTYFIDDRTRVSARYDQNFRFAKVNELALSNPTQLLESQTGESFELGLDLSRERQQLALSTYRLELDNEIVFDPNAGLFGENINLDKTRRKGLTLSWLSEVKGGFSLKAELGLVDAEFDSGTFDGNEVSGVAAQIASLRGDYRLDDFWNGYLEANYSSPKYAQGDNANEFGKLGSITVINAGADYRYKQFDLGFRVNNLNNRQYAEFVTNNGFGAAFQPSPERNYIFTASYRFE